MENNQQQPKQPTIWQSLAMIGGSALMSWGVSKLTPGANKSWVPYRDQMTANMAQIALQTAIEHFQPAIAPQQAPIGFEPPAK